MTETDLDKTRGGCIHDEPECPLSRGPALDSSGWLQRGDVDCDIAKHVWPFLAF